MSSQSAALNQSPSGGSSQSDSDKIKIKFIFANRDGINVQIECAQSDTVDTVKASLISLWPKEIHDTPPKSERIRLVCMGKGVLSPGNLTLQQCDIPVFLTHPTPVNVAVKPLMLETNNTEKSGNSGSSRQTYSSANGGDSSPGDCCCVVS
jgi:hypothetical protein